MHLGDAQVLEDQSLIHAAPDWRHGVKHNQGIYELAEQALANPAPLTDEPDRRLVGNDGALRLAPR